ncbi:hypothetical protein PBT90_11445 [Algoriphagus halophytocola]|uniref:hypothetical protein n=1 Tax=Algoriphagus halophytocola TaxID=2991499 RepID=UPI0022DDAAC7|nr:hypothetical protein [Algoriphagus sp. TR-M9]WBL41370.1 hypothetical protein PBT90_11445 [Algoriphagus sp. TR-M9]
MKQSYLIIIYTIVGTAMLLGCREAAYNYNCGLAASTPTDLRITNNTTREVEVTLKVKETRLFEFKQLTLLPYKSELLCIEYEGSITDGIHIEFENQTTIIKLKPQQLNEFDMKERKLK